MSKLRPLSGDFTKLREKAEKRLHAIPETQIRDYSASHEEMHRLIHELAVHKIELEIQQDELLQSREELEESLERYIELYDSSPLGYLTLARDSKIIEINLTAAKMLEVHRSLLKGDHFIRFIAAEDSSDFNAMLDNVYRSGNHVNCEVLLEHSDKVHGQDKFTVQQNEDNVMQKLVRIDGVTSNDGQECMITLLELGSAWKALYKNVLS